ncbi:protein kinase domain-containing protein [Rubrivirga sp.]|uniref:serine/threonine-protein kinase n=1 Tax=Rubrivirga sp. TaxID=1885344 RepID=UPI003C74A973
MSDETVYTGPPADPLIGVRVGEYHIESVLGRGGMGVVYKAEDTALGIPVALKSISAEMASDATFVRRFRTEARAMARVASPHIVRVMALRETEHGLFIVMEYVDGGDLHARLGAPMPWKTLWPLLRQMLLGLEAAHNVGVIHRDIKPRNVLLTTDDTVKLTDFGLARLQADGDVTRTQAVAGTLAYMSPEQVRSLPTLDHRSDLFSLGLTAYEALAGRLPFDRDGGDFTTMRAIVEEEFPPPTHFRPEVPAPVAHALMRVLERDPDQRYQSAAEMRDALAQAGDEQTPTRTRIPTPVAKKKADDRPATPPPTSSGTDATPSRSKKPSPLILGIGLIAVAALAAGGFWMATQDDEADLEGGTEAVDSSAAPSTGEEGGPAGLEAGTDVPATGDVAVVDPPPQQAQVQTAPPPQQVQVQQQQLPPPAQQQQSTAPPPVQSAPAMGAVDGIAAAGVTLTVDGSSISNTSRQLAPGTYTARCAAGPLSETTRVTVSPGQRTPVQCYAPARAVRVTTSGAEGAWMSVVVNGNAQGQTPTQISLPVGRHTVFVRRRGFEVINDQIVTVDVPPRFSPDPLPAVPVAFQVRAAAASY